MANIVETAKRLIANGYFPGNWALVRYDYGDESEFHAGRAVFPIRPGEPNIVRQNTAELVSYAPDMVKELAKDRYGFAIEAMHEDGSWGQEERFLRLVWYDTFEAAENALKEWEEKNEYQAFRIVHQRLSAVVPMTDAEIQEARGE